MRTKYLLAIGNSFSEDACRYLHQTAEAAQMDVFVVNISIGGCSLETHVNNLSSGKSVYDYQANGISMGRTISINDALVLYPWDYITLQQCSPDSGWIDSYEPFLTILIDACKKYAPSAQIYFHETWAYDTNSTHEKFMRYNCSQLEMAEKIRTCAYTMAEKHNLQVIPSGDIVQHIRKLPVFDTENCDDSSVSLTRDGYHMSFDYGRYLISLVYAKYVLQLSVAHNTYVPDCGTPVKESILDTLRHCVELFVVQKPLKQPLNVDEHCRQMLFSMKKGLPKEEYLLNAVMGLCGESGECIDIVKKQRFQGHELSVDKLAEELGDVAWYLAEAAYALDIPMSTILNLNIEKLHKRYPDGFDSAHSINRDN